MLVPPGALSTAIPKSNLLNMLSGFGGIQASRMQGVPSSPSSARSLRAERSRSKVASACVTSETGVLSQAPGPHQERCRCEVDRRFGCAERQHVVLIYGHLRPIKRTIISVEFLEGVGAVCWTQDHTADNARSRRTGRTLGSRTPKHWNAARSSIQRAGQVGHLVLDAVRKRCA